MHLWGFVHPDTPVTLCRAVSHLLSHRPCWCLGYHCQGQDFAFPFAEPHFCSVPRTLRHLYSSTGGNLELQSPLQEWNGIGGMEKACVSLFPSFASCLGWFFLCLAEQITVKHHSALLATTADNQQTCQGVKCFVMSLMSPELCDSPRCEKAAVAAVFISTPLPCFSYFLQRWVVSRQ